MFEALIYGSVSGMALLLGAILGIKYKFKQKAIAGFMAFGSGVLICAVTYSLMPEAFMDGGFDAVIVGFIAGGVIYIMSDYLIHRIGGRRHMRRQLMAPRVDAASGRAITVGAILDGIPESIALGVTIASGSPTSLLLASAILLSNFPEGISSVEGLTREKFSKKTIIAIWFVVGLAMATITVLSYIFLKGISANNLGIIVSFAGGAILAMLADTMMPEAYEEGGFSIGFATIMGFLTAFILSRL